MTDPLHLETIALHAWPAAEVADLDGWRLRCAAGVTRRANSVWPNHAGGGNPLDDKIAAAEAFYAARGQPAIFQISPAAQPPDLDAILDGRGYAHQAPTLVQTVILADMVAQGAAGQGTDVEQAPGAFSSAAQRHTTAAVSPSFDADWFDLYCAGEEAPPAQAAVRQAILRRIGLPCGYATLSAGGTPVAVALGVVEAGWLGIFNVVTLPAYRRQGAARALLAALARWAQEQGAARAYLQVMERNTAARALYAGLGFTTAYGYHYRVKATTMDRG